MEKYRLSEYDLAFIEQSCVPVTVYQFVDRRVVTLALSAGFCELFGFDDRAEAYYVMDNDMYRDAHTDDKARIADAAVQFATRGGLYDCVYRTLSRGEWRIVHAHGRHIQSKTGVRLAVVWYTDEGAYTPDGSTYESRLHRSLNSVLHENTLLRENHFDTLTGLPSMSYFFELATLAREKEIARGRCPAMVFIDLCGMRMYNRNNGFAEGDKLIRAVAGVLIRRFGNENCCRLAQDHFAVFSVEDGLEAALEDVFEKCRHVNGGKTLPVRAGIYLDRFGDLEVSGACDRAKAACDRVRRTAVSCWHYYDDSMMAEALNRQHILDNLDRAIAQGQIEAYYQAIVRAANGRVCHEEALARWNDPERGLLSPAEFIPVLEEAGLAYKLDLYILELALDRQIKQATSRNYVVPISVNLSRTDFDGRDMVEEIRRRVDESGQPRRMIIIEITESMLGNNFAFMAAQIDRFRGLGFQVWMDDFGSGYSSLDLLQSLRFDAIKFDMHFMQKFDHSENSRIILTELMKMALGLGVDTVVEGVETRAQADFLHEIGCTMLQGYFYSRPLSVRQIITRYAEGRGIGFENPEEADYYAAVGSVNLYNPVVQADEGGDAYTQYFDTIPMAVMEVRSALASIIRCNQSYRDMLRRVFGMEAPETGVHDTVYDSQPEQDFFDAVRRSGVTGDWVQFDRQQDSGFILHCFVKQLAVNPVTGAAAVADIVIAVRSANVALPAAGDSAIEQELHSVSANSVARALASDYLCIYYINDETNQFTVFSASEVYQKLELDRTGDDFFAFIAHNTPRVVYPEDQDLVRSSITLEKLRDALDTRGVFTLTYRLMVGGAPHYVHMKATRMRDRRHGVLFAVSDIDAQMREKAAYERARNSSLTYAHIAQALSKDYIYIYYIDLETDSFVEYSSHTSADDLAVERQSQHFFETARRDVFRIVYPDDQQRVLDVFTKEGILYALGQRGVFTLTYRLMANGIPTYVNMKAARMEGDERHIIIGVSDVDAQMRHQEMLERVKEERITYARISALSGDYIAIYTVDPATGHYTEYSATRDYDEMGFSKQGEDFFAQARTDGARTLYLEDLDLYLSVMTRENILGAIERNGVFSFTYRLMMNGAPTYVSFKAAMVQEKDGPQLIVGVVNVDDQVKRDQEYARTLSAERDRANFDALTGVKNKHAYVDVEARLNHQIEEGEPVRFALVICDVNDLKGVNDTHGHQAGDRYLQRARTIICRIFGNSPVFRVGGDEFAVLIQGQDYDDIDAQMAQFDEHNRRNAALGDITIAAGMARYAEGDRSVAAVFERADARMYEVKRRMEGRDAR